MARIMQPTTHLFANSPIRNQLIDLGNMLLRSLHYKQEIGFDGELFRYDSINDEHPINYDDLGGFQLAVENGGLGPVINANPNMETLISFCNTMLVDIGYKKQISLDNGLFVCIDLIPDDENPIYPSFDDNFEHFKLLRAFQEILAQFQPTPLNPMTRDDLQILIFDLLRWYGMDTQVYEGFLTIDVVYRFSSIINGLPGFPGLEPQAPIEYDAVNDSIFFN